MNDFQFPHISFVESSDPKMASIFFYSVENDKIKIKKTVEKAFPGVKSNLPKKANESFGAFFNGQYALFLNLPEKNIEKSIISVIKSIPKKFTEIQLFLDNIEFSDKILVSKIVYELKQSWNMKTEKTEFQQKSIFFVVKKAKDYNPCYGEVLGQTQSFVQTLVNMPSNVLTPTEFAFYVSDAIHKMQLPDQVEMTTLGPETIEEMKMGAFLGVAKGSSEEPRLITLQYNGGKTNEKPIVFVGKGLTFDSGGISIKPSNGMDAMKGDMAGAATAVAALLYAAKCRLPINVVAIAACCENMPSGSALKPGDVLTSMSGKTIEVLDTDAEGRLVLADALEFSKRFNGRYTIDLATLTGACIAALGYVHTGVFSKDSSLVSKLIKAGDTMQDIAWQLPLSDEHEDMLESKIADISNLCLGRGAGAQGAAAFLQRFAPKDGWCHLDIAGTSADKGGVATSRPLAMISEFLDNISKVKK